MLGSGDTAVNKIDMALSALLEFPGYILYSRNTHKQDYFLEEDIPQSREFYIKFFVWRRTVLSSVCFHRASSVIHRSVCLLWKATFLKLRNFENWKAMIRYVLLYFCISSSCSREEKGEVTHMNVYRYRMYVQYNPVYVNRICSQYGVGF